MFVDLLAHYVAGDNRSLPVTIEDVILARASHLSDETRRLLEIVAVVGQPVDRSVAERAAGLSDPGRSLETLRRDRLVRLRPQGARHDIEVYHDRIRESVRSTLDPERLRSHQGRLAAALEVAGRGDPETLAVLWRAAGEAEKAATFGARAADNAMSTLAFDRAARLYRMALDLQAEGSSEVGRLRLRLAEALANAGLGSEAADVYLALAESTRGAEALDIRGRAAEQLLKSARVKEGLAMAAVVLRELRVRLPGTTARDLVSAVWRRMWIRLRGFRFRERDEQRVSHDTLAAIDTCWSLTLGLSFTDPLRGWALQARHLALALKAGEPYRVARALAVEAGHEATLGTRAGPRTLRLLNRTTELARRTGRPHAEAVALMAAGFAAYFEGLWKQALGFFEMSDSILRERCTGVAWELNTCHVYALKCLFYSGAWSEVASRLPVLLKDAQERGDRLLEQGLVEGFFYFGCLADDEPDHARKRIRRGLDGAALRELRIENFWLVAAEVDVGLYCGDGAGNLALLGDIWPDLKRSQTRRVQQNRILACWLRSRSALGTVATGHRTDGERRALLEEAEADARGIRAECSRWGTALASLVDSGLQACRGHRRGTLLALDEAEASLEAAEMGGLIAAVVRRRRGEVLGGVEGLAQQEQADAWLKSQGIRRPERIADVYLPGNFDLRSLD